MISFWVKKVSFLVATARVPTSARSKRGLFTITFLTHMQILDVPDQFYSVMSLHSGMSFVNKKNAS